ncbi:MAG: hypothetical protein HN932_12870 [Candidatus Marinimicrobia bacterium]|nr:hypothetical protein [Candidatus Neomarinimicrobiota bacterium]MBT7339107.1 hypothetical protein [Candidatus Jacksonbacteria bacterium]
MSRVVVKLATTKEVDTAMGQQVLPAEKVYEYRNAVVGDIMEKFIIVKCLVSDARTAPKDVYIPISPLALMEVHYDDDAPAKEDERNIADTSTPKRKPVEEEVIVDG